MLGVWLWRVGASGPSWPQKERPSPSRMAPAGPKRQGRRVPSRGVRPIYFPGPCVHVCSCIIFENNTHKLYPPRTVRASGSGLGRRFGGVSAAVRWILGGGSVAARRRLPALHHGRAPGIAPHRRGTCAAWEARAPGSERWRQRANRRCGHGYSRGMARRRRRRRRPGGKGRQCGERQCRERAGIGWARAERL